MTPARSPGSTCSALPGRQKARLGPSRATRIAFAALCLIGLPAAIKWHPGHYVLADRGASLSRQLSYLDEIANEPALKGLHVTYFWAQLESSQGMYDFSAIDQLLARCDKYNKQLILEIWTRRFGVSNPKGIVPQYIQYGPEYGGLYPTGDGYGAKVWKPAVMDRLIALYQALASRYDRHSHFEAIVTAETAVGGGATKTGDYSSKAFVAQYKRLLTAATHAWQRTRVRLNANYITAGSDRQMKSLIDLCVALKCGVGGPDIFQDPRATPTQAQKILLGTLLGTDYRGRIPIMYNLETPSVKYFLPSQVYDYAVNIARASHMSWLRNTWVGTDEQRWRTGILPFIRSTAGKTVATCPASLEQCESR